MKETAEFTLPKAGGVSIQMGGPEGDTVRQEPLGTVSANSDDPKIVKKPEGEEEDQDADADAGTGADGDGADGEGDADQDGDADGDADEGVALPDAFKADDPEVVAAFDAKYSKDGALNDAALTAEFFANLDAKKDGLNDATYDYLASKGISKATVKNIEAMAATARDAEKQSIGAHDVKLFEIAGGPDALKLALEWGKGGGYTAEQQTRFNTINGGKDLEAKQEAVEALMSRYKRANPTAKPTVPRRDATKGLGKTAPGTKPYATRAEMRAARDAIPEGNKAGWDIHNKRLAASKFGD